MVEQSSVCVPYKQARGISSWDKMLVMLLSMLIWHAYFSETYTYTMESPNNAKPMILDASKENGVNLSI